MDLVYLPSYLDFLYERGPRKTWHYLLEGRPLVVQASPARLVF